MQEAKKIKTKPKTKNSVVPSLKRGLSISATSRCGTYIVAVVTSPVKEDNSIKTLSCKNFLPLGNMMYDENSDSYLLDCVDFLPIGTIPINFIASVKGCLNWMINLPLPEEVIRKFLSSDQKKELKKFFSSFEKNFLRSYIQMLDPNV